MIRVDVQKNLIGLEDLLVGVGTVTQRRGLTDVSITKVNAANFPYDNTQTLQQKIDEIEEHYQYIVDNRPLLLAALEVQSMFEQLQVNLDELAIWLTQGNNQLSAFKPFAQRVLQDETLAAGINHVMLEETIIEEDVTITLGTSANLYVLKGEEFTP